MSPLLRYASLLFAAVCLIGVSLAALAPQQPSSDIQIRALSRVALLIGNNRYAKVRPLDNAAHDAADFGHALEDLHFRVTVLTDADLQKTHAAVDQFVSGLKAGDVALLFYAGHGMQIDGENYLIPTDFSATTEGAGKDQSVRLSTIQKSMESSGAVLNMIVMDACRDNPLRGSRSLTRGLAVMDTELGTYVAMSTGPGQIASDNSNERNGLFTKYVLTELGKPGLTLDALFTRVRKDVYDASQGAQRPWVHSDLMGEFYFRESTAATGSRGPISNSGVLSPGMVDSVVQVGKRSFNTGDYGTAVQQFERARRVHPEDPFVCNALGVAYSQVKKFSLALEAFGQAIELKPEYAAAYYNRGLTYLNAQRYDLAVQDFSWSIDQEGFDPLVYDQRGRAYFGQLNYADALTDFQRALELNSSDALARLGLGEVAWRQGRLPDALEQLNQAARLNPALLEVYDYRAQVYAAMHKPAEAQADHDRARRVVR